MPTLKSRNSQIPGGLRFNQPETGFDSKKSLPMHSSFETIVSAVWKNRKANEWVCNQRGLALDRDGVARDVDRFNAQICAENGWNKFVMIAGGAGVAPDPKPQAIIEQDKAAIAIAARRAKKIWSGIKAINAWLASKAPGSKKAEERAAICAACPKNKKGGFDEWFASPALDAVEGQLKKLKNKRLKTSSDKKINVCQVCLFPLKVLVHVPNEDIQANMVKEAALDMANVPNCWVTREKDE